MSPIAKVMINEQDLIFKNALVDYLKMAGIKVSKRATIQDIARQYKEEAMKFLEAWKGQKAWMEAPICKL